MTRRSLMAWVPDIVRRHWREVVQALLVFLPFVTLPTFGLIWLWQQGYLVIWLLTLLVMTASMLAVRALWRPPPHGVVLAGADAAASIAEKRARDGLQLIADQVSAADVESWEAVQALIYRSFLVVAQSYRPGSTSAVFNFTLPEGLRMLEDASRRLRVALERDFPVLRNVPVNLAVHGTALFDPARKLWNVWRVLRLANPMSAVIQEARAIITGHALSALGESAKTKVAAMLVREISDVAIGLYSGAYRSASPSTGARPAEAAADPAPIVVLIAGQTNVGKSSLVNALLGEARQRASLTYPSPDFTRFDLVDEKGGVLALIDSPGLGPEPTKEWRDQALQSDLILWVVAANRADRAPDQRAIRQLRRFARDDIRLRQVPVVLVATHADRLAPPMEWSPPYEITQGVRPKEQNMRAALTAAGEALEIPSQRRVLVSVEYPGEKSWNIPALLAAIHDALDDARQKRLERGRGREGWLKSLVDLARSVPGTVVRISEFVRR